MMENKGIALVAVIILIIFVGFGVAGVTTFIAQRLIRVDTQQRDMRCRYNAQAGLHYALYQKRATAANFSGTVTMDSNNSARVSTTGGAEGGAASSLQINATASSLSNNKRDILGITLTNASASSAITLSQIIISIDSGTKILDQININGAPVWTANTSIGTSPVTLNMADVTIPVSATRAMNFIRWTSNMSGMAVIIQFIMSDATTTSACTVYPAPASTCQTSSSLTIQSTGSTAGSGMYRTVQATYNTSTGNVSNYTEITPAVP